MRDHTPLAVVQQSSEAIRRGDLAAYLDLLSEDVEWVYQGPSVIPFAGTRHGREGVAEFFTILNDTLEFEQFEPREFVAHGDTVVVLGFERSRLTSTDRTIEQEWAHVFTFSNGTITRVRSLDTAALAAVLTDAA